MSQREFSNESSQQDSRSRQKENRRHNPHGIVCISYGESTAEHAHQHQHHEYAVMNQNAASVTPQ